MVVTAQALGVLQTQGTGSALFPRYANSTNGRYQTQVNIPYISIFLRILRQVLSTVMDLVSQVT